MDRISTKDIDDISIIEYPSSEGTVEEDAVDAVDEIENDIYAEQEEEEEGNTWSDLDEETTEQTNEKSQKKPTKEQLYEKFTKSFSITAFIALLLIVGVIIGTSFHLRTIAQVKHVSQRFNNIHQIIARHEDDITQIKETLSKYEKKFLDIDNDKIRAEQRMNKIEQKNCKLEEKVSAVADENSSIKSKFDDVVRQFKEGNTVGKKIAYVVQNARETAILYGKQAVKLLKAFASAAQEYKFQY